MKNGKLAALLNTPARLVIAVGLLILLGEFLVMVVFEGAYNALPKDTFLKGVAFEFIDPLLLVILVSPALFLLFFKPMNEQQAELKDAHKKIRQAFQEWASALDAVDDPIFLHDQDFRILRCNKAYQQCAGIPFHEIIGQPYYEIFPKAATPLPCCLRAMEKAEEEEEEEELAAGGAIYRSRAFSIKDEQGAYLYSVHTLEDITERKRASETIIKAEAKFHTLFDSLSDAIFIIDMEGHFLDVNNSACKRLGYSKEELLQMRPTDIDTPEYAVKVPERIKLLQERGKLVFESAHVRKDGIVTPIELSTQIVNYDGKPAIIGVARDITERKQAEEKLHESEKLYRSLFENMLNGFAYCQMIFEQDQPQDFIYLSVNAAFETLTGLKNVAGKRVSEVIPGIRQSDPGLFEIYGRVSLSGKPEQFEIYVEALQQWFWISVYSPEKGYFVAVFDVITQRKQAEAKLTEQLEELRGWHDVTLGREMRVIELKHEVNELLAQAGQPPRYPSAESDDQQEK